MGKLRRRTLGGLVTALMLGLIATGVAVAGKSHRSGPFASHRPHKGLSAKTALGHTRSVSSRVIVILRNQVRAFPATKRKISSRIKTEQHLNTGIERQVGRTGGHIYRRFHALNAFAARVSPTEQTALQHSGAVAQVVPDTVVQLPAPINASSTGSASAGSGGSGAQQVCPTDPSKPLLEPEALQTTHTAFEDPSTPQAQSLATGKGVKVAFFADGLDINNPDFIRPDGSHVFIDYKDFSGDGLNGPTGAAEAFGDASSIAAQGRETYDISNFNTPAHPLPPGCNITVRGISPGASLIGMKVFGNANSAYNSVILQGLDYALSNDHPDVISESFGGYPIPDTTQDLTRQFNEQAVAAGVTVVESSGDSGVRSSPSSASSDPSVISAGASTTFRNYAQETQYAYQFAHGWLNDQISAIESAGFTMGGRVLDLVAPGEANWALCSADTAIYEECTNFAGQPTSLQSFGGTSESAPFIAGGAALIVQAYRESHNGASPSPAIVRQLLTSTATDLHVPTVEQGAGEMNTLAAVQAAKSLGGTPVGQNLLVGPTQLDLSGQSGTSTQRSVKVTNLGGATQIVHAHVRAITRTLSNQSGTVTLNSSSPTFVDQFGVARPYEKVTFTVPSGTDRLDSFEAWTGPQARVDETLIDPSGKMAAVQRAQGDGNHGEVDVHDPTPGTWTAIIFQRDGTFSGPVHWQVLAQKFGGVDSVSPSAVTLAPGQSRNLQVGVTFGTAGDASHDLELDSSDGKATVVPIVIRSLVALGGSGGRFTGDLIGGNGRGGAGPARADRHLRLRRPGGSAGAERRRHVRQRSGHAGVRRADRSERERGHRRHERPNRRERRQDVHEWAGDIRAVTASGPLAVRRRRPEPGRRECPVGSVPRSDWLHSPGRTGPDAAEQRFDATPGRQAGDIRGDGAQHRRRHPERVPRPADGRTAVVLAALAHAGREHRSAGPVERVPAAVSRPDRDEQPRRVRPGERAGDVRLRLG